MEKFIIAAFVCAGACVAGAADYADLKLGTNSWFQASVNGSALSATGISVTAGGDSVVYGDSMMEIDSDISDPVRFTASNSLTQDISTVVFKLEASVVPHSALPVVDSAKVAFAIWEDIATERNFYAWIGAEWVKMTGAALPEDGVEYSVLARFDNRNGAKKVQFSIINGTTEQVLSPAGGGSDWMTCASGLASAVSIDFVGYGKVKSLKADQLNVISEIIVSGDVKVEIPEADAAAMDAAASAAGMPVGEFLAANASVKIAGFKTANVTVAEAYALGMVAKNGGGAMAAVDGGEINVKASGTISTATEIKLSLTGISPRNDTGATVTYQLMGSSGGSAWTKVGAEVSDAADVAIPTSSIGTYNYFKVVTKAAFPAR